MSGTQQGVMFGTTNIAEPQMLKEYEHTLLKRRTKQGMQTNLILSEESEEDWLLKCGSV